MNSAATAHNKGYALCKYLLAAHHHRCHRLPARAFVRCGSNFIPIKSPNVKSCAPSLSYCIPLVVVAANVATIATATDFATTTQPYVVAVVVVLLALPLLTPYAGVSRIFK